MVHETGARLGLAIDLREPLLTLVPPGAAPFGPYLQILHFLCSIAEFYDSRLSAIYEFNPRGEVPEWLFDQYPSALAVRGNPFLNNAKSVETLNRSWASSKKPAQRRQAHALVTLTEALDGMGHAARRELADFIRRFLVRRMRLARGLEVAIPDSLAAKDVLAVARAVAGAETHTQGVLEQRLVDAIAALAHPPPAWVARGLGAR